MKFKTILSDSGNRIGIIKYSGKNDSKPIKGYFDKQLLKDLVNKYFDMFPEQDISISFLEGEDMGASMLQFWPDQDKKVAIAISGKSERQA